jgi:hypothetical protein
MGSQPAYLTRWGSVLICKTSTAVATSSGIVKTSKSLCAWSSVEGGRYIGINGQASIKKESLLAEEEV